jgi:hypothetical protein
VGPREDELLLSRGERLSFLLGFCLQLGDDLSDHVARDGERLDRVCAGNIDTNDFAGSAHHRPAAPLRRYPAVMGEDIWETVSAQTQGALLPKKGCWASSDTIGANTSMVFIPRRTVSLIRSPMRASGAAERLSRTLTNSSGVGVGTLSTCVIRSPAFNSSRRLPISGRSFQTSVTRRPDSPFGVVGFPLIGRYPLTPGFETRLAPISTW